MPIRYSNVVGGSSSTGFNLDVGATGNTTFYFDTPQPAGGYSITSQLSDSTIEFYAIAEDGTLSGYTNTKALSATKDFDTLVVYGATTNDLITFEYKSTTLPTASGDQDSGAAPFITSVSDADLANIDDTTIITGGNFATDVTVTFTGTDAVVRNPKSVVRTNSTQLIVTRPDDMLEDNAPYTISISNPGIPQSAYRAFTSSVTAGGDPVWVTAAGSLASGFASGAYLATVEATDPDGGTITYSLVAGFLPSGLSLNASTGEISGTATQTETQTFTIAATDSGGNITNRSFTILISVNAIGGTITSSDGYKYHTFTASGSFEVLSDPSTTTFEALIIAGGGGGGSSFGGGGGAGGLCYAPSLSLSTASYAITIGQGGAGGTGGNARGLNGQDSTAFGISAYGGGGGGSYNNPYNGLSGGSGGGGSTSETVGTMPGGAATQISGTGYTGYGNRGGNSFGRNPYIGTGGGGAGTQGQDISGGTTAGNGGNGLNTWATWATATSTGDSGYYAGGGAGASYLFTNGSVPGQPGLGGGGTSTGAENGIGGDGSPNTGSGGGGGGYPGGTGGTGGSGIVIIRYPA